MKKRTATKLALETQTVRSLTGEELRQAAGGSVYYAYNYNNYNFGAASTVAITSRVGSGPGPGPSSTTV